MSSTALAASQPSRQREHSKNKPLTVTRTVKAAIELMVEQGQPWDEAATAAGMSVRQMRQAIEKPHVLKYLRERKQVFRAAASAGNILRLRNIAHQDANLNASVNAIKVMEQIDGDLSANSGSIRAPGFNITIVNHSITSQPAPTIELTPIEQTLKSE